MIIIDSNKVKFRGKSRFATTEWSVINKRERYTLLNIIITKGIRHQIRIHLTSINCPIVGDKLYNSKKYNVNYHQLYAYGLTFTDLMGKELQIFIDVPFKDNLQSIKQI